MYNHDINKLTEQLIPPHLRQQKIIAFARLLISALNNIYLKFKDLINLIDKRISFNAQVCYLRDALRYYLNDVTIEILTNDEDQWQIYWYNEADQAEDIFLFKIGDESDQLYFDVWLFSSPDFNYEADFIIQTENVLTNDYINEIKTITNRYKLAGKRYSIKQKTI